MKKKFLLVIIYSSILTVIIGCSAHTLRNVPDQSIEMNISAPTEDDVKKAIIRAGSSQGWNMHADKPGHITATFHIRSHMAQVDIKYDLTKYNITYKASTNLKYSSVGEDYTDKDGTIHKDKAEFIHGNYNVWVRDLNRSIKTQLLNI